MKIQNIPTEGLPRPMKSHIADAILFVKFSASYLVWKKQRLSFIYNALSPSVREAVAVSGGESERDRLSTVLLLETSVAGQPN